VSSCVRAVGLHLAEGSLGWVRAGPGTGIQRREDIQLAGAEGDIGRGKVLAHAVRVGGLGDHDVADAQVPAEHDLRRCRAVLFTSDTTAAAFRSAPRPSGLYASTAIPRARDLADRAALWKVGWSSIWFTAGTTVVSASNVSRWSGRKLDTPMPRAPSAA
jgi:hypothetical protein